MQDLAYSCFKNTAYMIVLQDLKSSCIFLGFHDGIRSCDLARSFMT